jgi:hypothetical protein
MPNIAVGAAYSGFIQANGATSATVSGLPPGITANFVLATQRIQLSGTPTVGGTYNLVANLTNTCSGGFAPKTVNLAAGELVVGTAGPAFTGYSAQYNSGSCNIAFLVIGWAAWPGATGYEIEALPTPGATTTTGAVVSADVLSLVPSGTNSGVRIRALTAGGPSEWTYTGALNYLSTDPACSPQP